LAIDVSTVSRVVRNKFVQTIYGTYPIKKFFSFAFTTDEGVEISSHHAMLKLQEIVDGEDKAHPYSDELLALEMKNAGFPVARRTIAKYRERLHIPEKRLRRKK
jgi:RNA polymerase sigma-54 factor